MDHELLQLSTMKEFAADVMLGVQGGLRLLERKIWGAPAIDDTPYVTPLEEDEDYEHVQAAHKRDRAVDPQGKGPPPSPESRNRQAHKQPQETAQDKKSTWVTRMIRPRGAKKVTPATDEPRSARKRMP